jgi:signal transduction histidine kinase
MTLKQKILLLGAIPVLLMALVVNLSNYLVAKSDLESDLVVARERAIKERKALLSSYLMLAKTAIEGSYNQPDSPEVRQQVTELLRPLRYSSDGYFFVYDYQGNTILLPTRPEMEGRTAGRTRMPRASFLIQGIVKSAREGMASPVLDQQALYRAGCAQALLQSGARQVSVGHRHRLLSTTSTMSWRCCAPSARAPCATRCRPACC